MFDFAQTPKAFVPIVSGVKRFPASYFLHQKPSGKPLDDDMLGPYHIERRYAM